MNDDFKPHLKFKDVPVRGELHFGTSAAEHGERVVKRYRLERILTSANLSGTIFEPHPFYDHAVVLYECMEFDPDIDLKILDVAHGGSDGRLAQFIFEYSPLLRPLNDLGKYADQCREEFRIEQEAIRDEIDQIEAAKGAAAAASTTFNV